MAKKSNYARLSSTARMLARTRRVIRSTTISDGEPARRHHDEVDAPALAQQRGVSDRAEVCVEDDLRDREHEGRPSDTVHTWMCVRPNSAFCIVEGTGDARRQSATMRQPSASTAFMIASSFGLRHTAPQPLGEEIAREQEREQTADRRRRNDDRHGRHAVDTTPAASVRNVRGTGISPPATKISASTAAEVGLNSPQRRRNSTSV